MKKHVQLIKDVQPYQYFILLLIVLLLGILTK